MSNETLYKLDWETADIRLAKGRFVHTLRRPDAEMIYAREDELQAEIPINKDGSYSLPDPTANEAVDAKYYDRIVESATGYTGGVPELHKANAFQALYIREIYVDDDADVFADEVPVAEEVDAGGETVVTHVMRQPTEAELKSYRRKMSQSSEIKAGKRGRQLLVTRSLLKTAVQFYELWLERIEGATVGGKTYSQDMRPAFIDAVDPLIRRKVVTTFAGELTSQLLD